MQIYVVTCLRRHLPAEAECAVGMVENWLLGRLRVESTECTECMGEVPVAAGLRGSARLYGGPLTEVVCERKAGGSSECMGEGARSCGLTWPRICVSL